MRYTPARRMPMRCRSVRCTSMKHTPETHAHKMDAQEADAHEIHAREVHDHDRTLPFRVRLHPFGLGDLRRAVLSDSRPNPSDSSAHVSLRFGAAGAVRREEEVCIRSGKACGPEE